MNNAHFAQPQYLWLLLVVGPALAGFFYWSWRVKQKLVRQFVGSRLLGSLMVGVSHRREKVRLVLIGAAVVCLFLALARPQWGFVWEEARQQGLDIMVAVDTSRSMLAQDVAPNRLERAKLAALDLMRLATSDRLGLVAFAGTAFLQSPLTLDDEAFRQSVDALSVGIIPQGGTALSSAIRTALDAFEKGNDNHKVLILMTDGEDHDIDTETMAAAKEAAEAGVKIFTIGVGTPEGELLRVADTNGDTSFVKDDQGNVVKSRLNQTLLQQIATTAGGFYLPLQGADPMKTLYDRGLAPLPRTTSTTKLTRVYEERYHWPLALAIVCLALEIVLPESTTGRRRKGKSTAALAAAALLFLLTIAPAAASPSSAFRDYQNGKYDSALDEYSRLSEVKTNDYRLHYNAGAAAYQTKDYDKALQQFNTTLQSPAVSSDLPTQEHTYYDLGNTLYRMGEPLPDPDQKKKQWQEAVQNYGHALQLNTNDIDAKNNLAYVQQKLKQLKQQQQQQQQQKNDKNKDDKNKDQQSKNNQSKDQKNKQDQKQNSQDQKDKQQQQQQQAQNDKQKQDEQKKQQQQQAQQDKDKKDKEAQANKTDDRDQSKENPDQAGSMMAQMTPQEARQLLDAQRDDEKALIFQPTNMPSPPPTSA